MAGGVSVVIPTVGRASLATTLTALAADGPPAVPAEVLVVDDRPERAARLMLPAVPDMDIRVLAGRAAGPAAARNVGWRVARYPWVAFLDDDVVPEPGWFDRLVSDLDVPALVGGVQGRVQVPLPAGRRPTDWERHTAGLAGARWITADMAYRKAALADVGGFDERFPRAYREDAELAYRVRRAGWQLVPGVRSVVHPVRTMGRWASLRAQRGNADDALLRRLYGPTWRTALDLPCGRRPRHALITAAGLVALLAAVPPRRRGRPGRRVRTMVGTVACATWLAGTGELAAARIGPGPKTTAEVGILVATSLLIPPLASYHWLRGWWSHRGVPAAHARNQALPALRFTSRW